MARYLKCVNLKPETYERLMCLGRKDQTFNDIVEALLNKASSGEVDNDKKMMEAEA